jgi:hypothetical protein
MSLDDVTAVVAASRASIVPAIRSYGDPPAQRYIECQHILHLTERFPFIMALRTGLLGDAAGDWLACAKHPLGEGVTSDRGGREDSGRRGRQHSPWMFPQEEAGGQYSR